LTLQTVAVRTMLAIDKGQARRLFADMSSPKLPRLACSDAFIPNVDLYYQTAGEVAQGRILTPGAKKRRAT